MPTYGQMQLACPSRAPLLPLCLCTVQARSLYRRAEPSPPVLSHGTARVASTQSTAIKGGHPLRLVRTNATSTSGKPSPPHSPLFSTTSSVPSHLTPPLSPYTGPRTSPEPRTALEPEGLAPSPPLSSDAVDHAGELRLSIIFPPRFDSTPGTISGRCAEVQGCFPWTSSRGSSNRRTSLAAPRRVPTPCGPRHGLSMASASGHTMPGGAPSLGSSAVCSLAVG
jgi:hypothetical protein